jgi:putative ABC transport system substrate-binding protein
LFSGISCAYARNATSAQIWYFDPCAVSSHGAITMDRRRFMALSGAAAIAWPLTTRAQQVGRAHRVGVIFTSAEPSEMAGEEPINPAVRMFVHTLRELGYLEGSNLALERRSAEGRYERFSEIVRDLVSLKADVIVTITNPMTHAAKEVTSTIPIVMGISADPVGEGLVQSLARPGGNITGLSLDMGHDIVAKRIQLLKELVPTMSRVVLLQSKAEPLSEMEQILTSASQHLGVELLVAEATPTDYTDAFALIEREKPDGLLVGQTAGNYSNRSVIVEFAARNRLPAMYAFKEDVAAGGLAAYGVDVIDLFRRAAGYVDKILRGANPGELPVEQPTKFQLIINLTTASSLGLTVPPLMLARADEVFE